MSFPASSSRRSVRHAPGIPATGPLRQPHLEPPAPRPAAPQAGPAAEIARLQSTVGNRAVSSLFRSDAVKSVQGLWPGFTWLDASGGKDDRKKVLTIDQSLTAFHKTNPKDFAARKQAAEALDQQCAAYLKLSYRSKERRSGVKTLREQAKAEIDLYGKLAAAEKLDYGAQMAAMIDLGDDAAAYRTKLDGHVTSASTEIQTGIADLIKKHDKVDPKVLAGILAKEVAHLRAIAADTTAPQIVRDIVSENLGHVEKIHFRAVEDEGANARGPGAREGKKDEETGGKKYVVNHQLIQPGGAAERTGSLVHEMTHVATGEAFGHAPLFVVFQRGKQNTAAGRAEIKQLAISRKGKVDELEKRVMASAALRPDQQGLVVSKLGYGKKSILAQYLDNFKAILGGVESESYKGLNTLALDPDINKFDATLVEYDSVVNQVVLYFHEWQVPADEPAYKFARDMAVEAQKYRTSQGG